MILNLEKTVELRKSAQDLDAPDKIKNTLVTNQVTTVFLISPCTSISYTSFSHSTDFSRLKYLLFSFCLISLLISLPSMAIEYDPDIGEEINDVCAGCHGEYGQGGKEGEYPRIAGMPAEFISTQLELFRSRKRPNMPMLQYIDERQMPDEDIFNISHFLANIKLNTRLPAVDETAADFDAYARLLESKKLMQIPLAPGDIGKGQKLYKKECASCHGKDGYGVIKKAVPLLAGQYTRYLWNQVEKLRKRIRIHDIEEPDEELLDDFSEEELMDIFAWLSTADD